MSVTMTEADGDVRCPELRPFLRMLSDDMVLDGKRTPNRLDLRSYSKIHNLVYLARRYFGHPGLTYEYDSIMDGPFSLDLSNDLYDVGEMGKAPVPDGSKWPEQEKFRKFVKMHNDANWIQIAATISQINDEIHNNELDCAEGEDKRDCVIRHVTDTQAHVEKHYVASVYDTVLDDFHLASRAS